MKWTFTGDTPIYAQLMDQLKAGIVSGEFPPSGRLPSVRELAAEAGVNPNTMQRSLSELERDGLVVSQRTAGRFVTEDKDVIERTKKQLARGHIQTFLTAMGALGYSRDQAVSLVNHEEEL